MINSVLQLYHGSKHGIKGNISWKMGREQCDFGKGFYLGDKSEQAKQLILDRIESVYYEMELNCSHLQIACFENMVDWALYIAVHRKKVDATQYPKLQEFVKRIDAHDVVVGVIADDRLHEVYPEFVNGTITDKVLIECLKYVQYGNQYVLKSDLACGQITILTSRMLNKQEIELLRKEKAATLQSISSAVAEIKKSYRRDGRFFDEILEDYR